MAGWRQEKSQRWSTAGCRGVQQYDTGQGRINDQPTVSPSSGHCEIDMPVTAASKSDHSLVSGFFPSLPLPSPVTVLEHLHSSTIQKETTTSSSHGSVKTCFCHLPGPAIACSREEQLMRQTPHHISLPLTAGQDLGHHRV